MLIHENIRAGRRGRVEGTKGWMVRGPMKDIKVGEGIFSLLDVMSHVCAGPFMGVLSIHCL